MSDKPRPWQVLRRETIYDSPWVRLHRDDVRLPDGTVIEGHHVVEYPRPAVCVVPVGDDGRILLIEHYRFVSDTTGWEAPAGRVDEEEALEVAAARELLEETGYAAGKIEHLGQYHPINGSASQTFHIYMGSGIRQVGEPTDVNEIMRVAWFTPDEVWAMLDANEIRDGLSLTALLWYLARERVKR